jgi:hypothetical protein
LPSLSSSIGHRNSVSGYMGSTGEHSCPIRSCFHLLIRLVAPFFRRTTPFPHRCGRT